MTRPPRDDHLTVVLSFDADPDRFDPSQPGEGEPTWRGIEEGIPTLVETLEDRAKAWGRDTFPVTWFVRADLNVARHLGSVGGLLDRYDYTWKRLHERGDELAYHPHLIVSDEKTAREAPAVEEQIEQGADAMRARGFQPAVSRIGEARGSSEIFQKLDELGFVADSTAMPGRRREDESRSFDWIDTPRVPYHPSREDHRFPGPDPLALLEIPMTMVPLQAPYDDEALPRYVDLTFHPELLEPGLELAVAEAPLLVTVGHPSTVLPELSRRDHPLFAYSAEAVGRNLDQIIRLAEGYDRSVEFRTMSGCVEAVEEGILPAA